MPDEAFGRGGPGGSLSDSFDEDTFILFSSCIELRDGAASVGVSAVSVFRFGQMKLSLSLIYHIGHFTPKLAARLKVIQR